MFKPKKVRGQVMPGQWEQREPLAQIRENDENGKFTLNRLIWTPAEVSGGHHREEFIGEFDTLDEAKVVGEGLPV